MCKSYKLNSSVRMGLGIAFLIGEFGNFDALVVLLELPVALSVENEHVVVVLVERLSVRHSEEVDSKFFAVVIEQSFHFEAKIRGALIENSEHGFMVEKSGHSDCLFFATSQRIVPISSLVESLRFISQIVHLDFLEQLFQIVVVHSSFGQISRRVRVNDLVS